MSRTIRNTRIDNKDGSKGRRGRRARDHEVTVRVVRRRDPDLRRMGRALIALALAEAEQEAQGRDEPRTKHDGAKAARGK